MSNQSRGRKKSQFIETSSLLGADTLDVVRGGSNLKVSYTNFLAGLGVTGTLVQDGSVSGTPVLDVAGTVNNIRNLEDGPGVKSSVSAENGITLEHNFAFDTVGTPLTPDATALSPIMRSLSAGSGMTIGVVDDRVVFTATALTVASNVVVVNVMGDFPSPVSGVITLLPDTAYLVSAALTTSDRFVFASNTVMLGTDRFVAGLTYTGAGDFFTSSEVSIHIKDITLDCPSGTVFNFSSTGGDDIFLMDNLTITSCDNLGTMTGIAGARFSNIIMQDIKTSGITFTGSNGVLFLSGTLNTVNGGAYLDLGAATFEAIACISCFSTLASGTNFIDGLVSSGNITAGNLGSVTDSRFFGAGTPLNNISATDSRWQFALNDDIPDTRPDGLLSLQGNATETVIAVSGTPVLIEGTWTVEKTAQFTGTAAGRLTYDGIKDATIPITLSISIDAASGGDKQISLYLFKNGSEVTNATKTGTVASGKQTSITIAWQDTFAMNDYVEAFVSNDSNTVNLVAVSGTSRVN